ncbi:MAG TPA: hypothetical protein VL422_14380 [Miltoncostaea sp.]|jgi:hypothetical protein|nr:hypothetical protein [Miltoncostaea sp.]
MGPGLVARPVSQRPLAILAYGSLLHSPGALGPLITGVVPCRTPFPVEYGRASQRWNGGPVLVPHPDGAPVEGGLLLLAPHLELGTATDLLAEREGLISARGILQVEVPGQERLVLTCSLPRNLPAPDMTPDALARRAVASVHRDGRRNGVRYLAAALASGVVTPRTEAYRDAVLSASGAATLGEAERLLALPRSEGGGGAADGLG